jgi:uroporphyrinogen-III synthase
VGRIVTGALITRPRHDADVLARALEARGFRVFSEPLLAIAPVAGVALPLDGIQGFLATSANGVRALAANLANRADFLRPLWAVGDATARAARDAGFGQVESAGGDVQGLARLVAGRVEAGRGALLHAAGETLAGDLAGRLGRLGFEVRRVVLYSAVPATGLSPPLLAALDGGGLELALFFSPRTAETFATLASAAGRQGACRRMTAYGLSPAVAKGLAALPWRAVRTAAAPRQEALLAAIEQDYGLGGGPLAC